MEVSYEEFAKLELRVGKVIQVEDIPESTKLLKLTVDFGNEKRIAVAGIKQQYKPEDLLNKKFVFVTNLQRRKIMGIESQCMILAAEDNGTIALLQPIKDVKEGSKIR
ncbi:MAG: methionine--tRNA ligase subunit beta [Candidatus Aenigmatarchaeota archaeon]|jgi:methionyl-tRNA synthetase